MSRTKVKTEAPLKRADHHSHIIHAGIEDMVASAKARGVEEYSITEHVSQFQELRRSVAFGSVHTAGRMFQSLDEYVDEFERIDRTDAAPRVYCGLEVDYSPRFLDSVSDFVNRKQWDTLLCSVHEFGDGQDVERKMRGDGPIAGDRWDVYIHLQTMALESSFVPFSILAHPVRLSRGTNKVPEKIDDLLFGLAKTARKNGRALELNGNDIDYNQELVRKLAAACSKADCAVSLGSDAHYPRNVFKNIEVAMRLVNEFKLVLWHRDK